MENPIKENRYINDITFATRLKNFIEHTGKTYGARDFLIDEEWEYLLYVANKLVNWQKDNATEEDLKYFENLLHDSLESKRLHTLCMFFRFYKYIRHNLYT